MSVDHVVAVETLDGQLVDRAVRSGDAHGGVQALRGNAVRLRAGDCHRVGAVGAVDDYAVGRPVARRTGRAGEVHVHVGEIGTGQVVDRDVVSAAQCVRVHPLDAVEIHRDGADVAEEAHPRTAGRHVHGLVPVRAVEQQGVQPVLALDGVAAVAWIPLEGVVPRAQQAGVVTAVAVHEVVTVATDQLLGAVPTQQRVVAGAAVHGELDEAGEAVTRREPVVAAVRVEDELLAGADVERERERVDPVEAHPRAVRSGRECLGSVAADHLHGVVAVTALVDVAVVARVPDELIVAGLAERLVVAVAADEPVVAVAAEETVAACLAEERVASGSTGQQVVGGAAGQLVVAGSAVYRRGRHRTVRLVDRQGVVAGSADDPDQTDVGDGRIGPADRDGAAVDIDRACRVAADDNRVARVVADDGQDALAQYEVRRWFRGGGRGQDESCRGRADRSGDRDGDASPVLVVAHSFPPVGGWC